MNEKESPSGYFRREEIRGLFVLGLLAVIASIRIQSNKIIVTIGQNYFDVVVFLDIIILLWSFYAFFMVLGLSEDIIGKKPSSMFREVSKMYLNFSFVILALLSILLVYSAYPTRTPWALGFIPVLFLYWLIRKLRQKRKPFKISFSDFWKRVKSNLYQLLLSTFMVCFLLIMFGTHEEFVIPSFIIGSVALVSFLIAREKLKKSD